MRTKKEVFFPLVLVVVSIAILVAAISIFGAASRASVAQASVATQNTGPGLVAAQ